MKFSSIINTLLVGALTVVALTVGLGQGDGLRVEGPEVSLMIWDAGVNLPQLFNVQDGDEFPVGAELYVWEGERATRKLVIPYGTRSEVFPLQSGRELVILKRPFLPEVENDHPPVAMRVMIPENVERGMVLMVPDDLLNNEYRGLVFNENLDKFPTNSLRIVNFSSAELIVKLDDETFQLAPRASKIVGLDPQDKRTARMIVARQSSGREGYDYITRRIGVFQGARSSLFFVDSEDDPTLRTKLITEDTRYLKRNEPSDQAKR